MDIEVQHNSKCQRFEAHIQRLTAYLSYTFHGNAVSFDHTFVPEELRGKGLAAALVRKGLEVARARHWKVEPSCSYVAAFLQCHPEFADLVISGMAEDKRLT